MNNPVLRVQLFEFLFRREMELLQQEKMAHVEELRQIHADINAVSDIYITTDLETYCTSFFNCIEQLVIFVILKE
jgi:hypothetical protein